MSDIELLFVNNDYINGKEILMFSSRFGSY